MDICFKLHHYYYDCFGECHMIIALFGKPRAGKTTIAAAVVQTNKRKKNKYYKRISKSKLYPWVQSHKDTWYGRLLDKLLYSKSFYDVVYCTDETMQDTIHVTYEDLGKWKPYPNALLILEECGLGMSNRDFKNLSKYSKRLAAKHGHMGLDVILSSQSTDFDRCWKERAQINFIVSKLGPFTIMRKVTYSVDVNNETHKLDDMYEKIARFSYIFDLIGGVGKKHRLSKFPFLKSRIIIRRFWYKYFDSYEDVFDYPMEDPFLNYLRDMKDSEDYFIKEMRKKYLPEGIDDDEEDTVESED